MSLQRYLAVGCIAFILGILGSIPARLLAGGSDPLPGSTVRLYGVRGSIWNGSAEAAHSGPLRLESLRWSLSPLALLTAAASLDLKAHLAGSEQSARLVLRPGGRIRLSDLSGELPLSTAASALGVRWLPLAAQIELHMDALRLRKQAVVEAEGQAVLRDAHWTLLQPPASLGNIRADVSTDDERVVARLDNDGGSFAISGTASLGPDSGYTVDIRLQARPDAAPDVRKALEGFGQPLPDGGRQLKLQGKLAGNAPRQ